MTKADIPPIHSSWIQGDASEGSFNGSRGILLFFCFSIQLNYNSKDMKGRARAKCAVKNSVLCLFHFIPVYLFAKYFPKISHVNRVEQSRVQL